MEDMVVNAVLDRLAGVNLLAWHSPDGDSRPTPIDASRLTYHGDAAALLGQIPSDSPATVITLSADAQQQISALTLPEAPEIKLPEPAASPVPHMDFREIERHSQLKQLEIKLNALDRLEEARQRNTEHLARLEASYKKMRDTPPKAAVKLEAEGVEKALKMLKDAGVTLRYPGKDGSFIYGKDHVQYNFKGDGTVTTQEESVATSLEDQQRSLSTMDNTRAHMQYWLRDTSDERAALAAQRNALMGQS